MKREDFVSLKGWFKGFCESFYSTERDEQLNIALKERHSFSVWENMSLLAPRYLDNEEGVVLAEAVGLLHDVGRFPQYARYKTFRDSISINHGVLGVDTLIKEGALARMNSQECAILTQSVKYHNAYKVPTVLNAETETHLKLIRDADKLDIWRVFIEYFDTDESNRPSAAALGLPLVGTCSDEVKRCIYNRQMVALKDVSTLDDYKLLQLSWIFDLNFSASHRLLLDRGYIGRILGNMPQANDLESFLTDCVKEKANG
ncbi:metal-dependent phosphohydrolase HD sub domain-containing protein [Candidatus Magnetobacterium bavaricum]|uniref:Metal-dependent phosphohydrolase HD sub domain-containing protein n=1 Tax=Candidatus Magnetobacterium bavaricum TaxID=29290 RepID=A0A0F3GVA3_9BACT|nr:metal-dependent phosphohydrolase HD sub domain-containing protein [Candidatus Magnetobacterium bavaricum]